MPNTIKEHLPILGNQDTPTRVNKVIPKRLRSSPESSGAVSLKKVKSTSDMAEIHKEVGRMSGKDLLEQISSLIDGKLLASKDDIESIKTELFEIKKENLSLKGEVESLREEIKKRDIKLEALENFTRRNNLLFKGVKGDRGAEKETIIKFCREVLGTEVSDSVQEAYRVETSFPMIKVVCAGQKQVLDILRNSRRLKGTGFFIDRDYCWETRVKRGKLFRCRKEFLQKNPGLKIRIVADTLIMEGRRFKWDEKEGLKGASEEDQEWMEKLSAEK